MALTEKGKTVKTNGVTYIGPVNLAGSLGLHASEMYSRNVWNLMSLMKVDGEFKINWNIVSWPGSAWASRVFPELPLDEAIVKLADAIFDASRASVDDPIQAWDDHNEKLRIKTERKADWPFSRVDEVTRHQ